MYKLAIVESNRVIKSELEHINLHLQEKGQNCEIKYINVNSNRINYICEYYVDLLFKSNV